MNTLENLLQSIGKLNPVELQKALDHTFPLTFKKNEHLLKEGQTAKHVYFIEEGYLRSYEIVEGIEKTMNFGKPKKFMTNLESYGSGNPSPESIQAITDCRVVKIAKTDLEALSQEIPQLAHLQNLLFQEIFRCKEDRMKGFIQQKAIDRYKHFVTSNPDLVQVVSVNHLSSYLGIAPETLSRIRSKVVF